MAYDTIGLRGDEMLLTIFLTLGGLYLFINAAVLMHKWEEDMLIRDYKEAAENVGKNTRCCICGKPLDIMQTQRVIRIEDEIKLACISHPSPEIVRFIMETRRMQ